MSCYKVESISKSWNDARTACQEFGADLASIPDEATNTFLTTRTTSLCWAGAYKDSSGNWKWTDGSTLSYTNWAPGQPNGNSDKMVFNFGSGVGEWDDGSPPAPAFICQLKINGKLFKNQKRPFRIQNVGTIFFITVVWHTLLEKT